MAAQILFPKSSLPVRFSYPRRPRPLMIGYRPHNSGINPTTTNSNNNHHPTNTTSPTTNPSSEPLEISISIPYLQSPFRKPTVHFNNLVKSSLNLFNGNHVNTGVKVLMRPFCVILQRSGGSGSPWEILGRTETVEYNVSSQGIRFLAKLKINVRQDKNRLKELRVEVWDRRMKSEKIDDQVFIGVGGCSVEEIVGHKEWTAAFVVREGKGKVVGKVKLSGDLIKKNIDLI